ncbi:MAG: NOL1/NOP2/sun family putative RNA methylase [Halobacteriaceae archaeon]
MEEIFSRYQPLIDGYDSFLTSCREPLPTVIRVNTIKATSGSIKKAFDEHNIEFRQVDWNANLFTLDVESPGNTWPYFHGWIHSQEEVSALPVTVLDPRSGERIFDACAAPGSKTSQIAAHMDDLGILVANDDDLNRLSALRSNTDRLGITNTIVTNRDGRYFDPTSIDIDKFDRTLVDVPCSCEGTIRKNPNTLDSWSEGYIESVSHTQQQLLRQAVRVTKQGGTIVYSTCTFAPEENERVVDEIITSEPVDVVPFDIPLTYTDGITQWRGESYTSEVTRTKRIYPHQNNTGGFFIAKLEVQQ